MAEGRLNKELLEMNERNTAIQNKVKTRSSCVVSKMFST